MKKLLCIILLFAGMQATAQTNLSARTVEAKDSIKIKSNWIKEVQKDTNYVSDSYLPTSLSIKKFIEGRLAAFGVTPSYSSNNGIGLSSAVFTWGGALINNTNITGSGLYSVNMGTSLSRLTDFNVYANNNAIINSSVGASITAPLILFNPTDSFKMLNMSETTEDYFAVVVSPGGGFYKKTFPAGSSGEPTITASNTIKKYWNGYKQFVSLNTDSIPEGSTNLFHTTARVRAAMSANTATFLNYNSSTGVYSIDTTRLHSLEYLRTQFLTAVPTIQQTITASPAITSNSDIYSGNGAAISIGTQNTAGTKTSVLGADTTKAQLLFLRSGVVNATIFGNTNGAFLRSGSLYGGSNFTQVFVPSDTTLGSLKIETDRGTYTFPRNSPVTGQILKANSSGGLIWASDDAGSGGTSLPSNATGALINDGSGGLSWQPILVGEPTIAASNTIKKYWNGYKQFVSLNTDSIPEGSTNLFHTTARVRAALSSNTGTHLTYNSSTGVFGIDTANIATHGYIGSLYATKAQLLDSIAALNARLIAATVPDTIHVDPVNLEIADDTVKIIGFDRGSYIPTVTVVDNLEGVSGMKCYWTRNGNIVTITGSIFVQSGASVAISELRFSLPIISDFDETDNAIGIAHPNVSNVFTNMYVLADTANDEISLQFNTASAMDETQVAFTLSYIIY